MKMQAGVPGSQQAQAQAQRDRGGQSAGPPGANAVSIRKAGTAGQPSGPLTAAQRQQQQQAMTFAEMQQQGRARPAPAPQGAAMGAVAGAPAPAAAPAAPATPPSFLNQLNQQVQDLRNAPSVYDTPEMQQIRAAQMANLNAEFGAQRSILEEELARRGLADSTIAGGRFGDLAGQQSRAVANVDADLLQKRAAAEQERQNKITELLKTGTQAEATERSLSEDVRQFDVATELEKTLTTSEQDIKRSALSQEQEQFEASLDETRLQRLQALGLSKEQLDLQVKQLQQEAELAGEELSSREAMQRIEIDARAEELATQIQADAEARGETFSYEQALQQARVQAEADLQTERLEAAESQFTQTLSLEERQFEQAKTEFAQQFGITEREMNLGEAEFAAQKDQFDREQKFRKDSFEDQLKLDRDRLGLSESELEERRRQFDQSQGQQENQFQSELQVKRDALEQAQSQFDATLDEDSRQFNEELERRRQDSYSQDAGRVWNEETKQWEDTLQRESVESDTDIRQKQLLIQLSEVLAGAGGEDGLSKSEWDRLSKILNRAKPDNRTPRDPNEGEDPEIGNPDPDPNEPDPNKTGNEGGEGTAGSKTKKKKKKKKDPINRGMV